mgnify:CR=1 FL=1
MLCDFGTTRKDVIGQPIDRTQFTPALLPPELYWLPQADTWQLGLLLVMCRTGWMPSLSVSGVEQLQASGKCSNLLPVEWDMLKVCLEPNPGIRPPPLQLRNVPSMAAYLAGYPEADEPWELD